jgi:hypothetical protein
MTTKLLVGISSCNRFETNGFNGALRSTCLQGLGIDYKIFHGDRMLVENQNVLLPVFSDKVQYVTIESKTNDDVVIVPVNDGFFGIMAKYVAKCQYALNHGYDYLFNCYYDTYFVGNRLLSSGFEKYDYCGKYGDPSIYMHCQSGAGVFLSRKMCQIVCDEMSVKTQRHPLVGHCELQYGYGEDLWTGLLFGDHRFELTTADFSLSMIDLFSMSEDGPRKQNQIMSMHMSPLRSNGVEYQAEHMIQKHKEWLDS